MNVFNLFVIENKHIVLIGLLLLSVGLGTISYISHAQYNQRLEDEKQVLETQIEANKKYSYVETVLKEYFSYLEKIKNSSNNDILTLSEEIKSLKASGNLFTNITIQDGTFNVKGKATNYKYVDFQKDIFYQYNKLFGGFTSITLQSAQANQQLIDFEISGTYDVSLFQNRLFSNDIDGDGIKDYDVVTSTDNIGISRTSLILKDLCPFTPRMNLILGKIVSENSTYQDVFPFYGKLNKEGNFYLQENGCLKNGDVKL